MTRFDNRTVLITGAASGIGRACAKRFVEEGAFVALIDHEREKLDEVAAELASLENISTHTLDVSDEAAVAALIDRIVSERGGIDALCNNAGTAGDDHSAVFDNDTDNWRRVLDVNLMGTFYFIRAVAPHMRDKAGGAIVNTASVAGIRSGAGGNAYSASKAAIISLTQTAACDLGGDNIRVNAVCPGLIKTGMTQPVFDYAAEHGKQHTLRTAPFWPSRRDRGGDYFSRQRRRQFCHRPGVGRGWRQYRVSEHAGDEVLVRTAVQSDISTWFPAAEHPFSARGFARR